MIRLFAKSMSLIVLLTLMGAVKSIAFAGEKTAFPGNCFKPFPNSTIMRCTGDMLDIAAQTADSTRFAQFRKVVFSSTNTASLSFAMSFNGTFYSCTGSTAMLDAWNSVMSAQLFAVEMDPSTGLCISVETYNYSNAAR